MQSVMNMMHVISVPYSLMKVNPLSWIQKVCQYKGQTHTPPAAQLSHSSPFIRLSENRLNANFLSFCLCLCVSSCSQGGVCEVQRYALGSGGPQRPEGHQPELSAHAAGGRRIKPL